MREYRENSKPMAKIVLRLLPVIKSAVKVKEYSIDSGFVVTRGPDYLLL